MFLKKELFQNSRVGAEVMKKQLLMIGILALLVNIEINPNQKP